MSSTADLSASVCQGFLADLRLITSRKLADAKGIVDITVEALARRTNVPINIVRDSIKTLCKADPHSRSTDEHGARLVPLDVHRDWGWQIVNYEKYRGIWDVDAKRDYYKNYRRKERENNKGVQPVQVCSSQFTQAEAEEKALIPPAARNPSLRVLGKQYVSQCTWGGGDKLVFERFRNTLKHYTDGKLSDAISKAPVGAKPWDIEDILHGVKKKHESFDEKRERENKESMASAREHMAKRKGGGQCCNQNLKTPSGDTWGIGNGRTET